MPDQTTDPVSNSALALEVIKHTEAAQELLEVATDNSVRLIAHMDSAEAHGRGDITGNAGTATRAESAALADAVPWAGVTDKPATFTPASHSHAVGEISGTLPTSKGGTGRTDGKAVALATSRSISLSGDVTGSGSFDGSGNVNISVTLKAGEMPSNGMVFYAIAGYPAAPIVGK